MVGVAGVRLRFRFHGEVNDFLKASYRQVAFDHVAGSTDTLKHVLESLGVPHTEIARVTVNGEPHHLSEQPEPQSYVEVFPHGIPIHLPTNPRFVVDGHLGRLAAYLRMLGFDTWYERVADDALLASISHQEHRLLLTRDVGLLKRREVEQGYCVRAHKPQDQLRELTSRFTLQPYFAPFTRCMECNGALVTVAKSEVSDLLPPHTRATKSKFSRCLNCRRIFWAGSHHTRMLGWIENLRNPFDSPAAIMEPKQVDVTRASLD